MNCITAYRFRSVAHFFRRFSVSHVVVLALLLVGVTFLASGQEGTLVGTVTDPSGAAVPNVTVTITHVETGRTHTYTTNETGQYVAPSLPIGKYDLKAASTGFKLEETKGIVLNVNDRIRVDFQMKLGTASETVSVEANAVAVQADTSEQSSLISGTQISQLATNGRSIYTYVTLTTGASNLMPDFQIPTPTGGNANISFNGNRPGHNLYLLDGGENSDRGGAGASDVMPSVDALAETQTLTSNYSADYGLSSGGTISSAVKSGTTTFHASAWEFFRNDALDARNFFNTAPHPVAELRYNVYGFNVGGPVTFGQHYNPEKNKTFFFYNMEWRKLIQGGLLNQTVPYQSTYGGDFNANLPKNVTDKVDNAPIPFSGLHAPCQSQLSPALVQAWQAAGQTTFSTPDANGGCTANANVPISQNPTFVPLSANTIPTAPQQRPQNARAISTTSGLRSTA